jgi:hypothetical protein
LDGATKLTFAGYGTSSVGGTAPGYGGNSGLGAQNTQGFSNQVDQAFGQGQKTNGNGINGNTNTVLGQNNPVYTGSA